MRLKTIKKKNASDLASTHQFSSKKDQNGLRYGISLDNEGGCPFKCPGCGVHENSRIVSPAENRKTIAHEIAGLKSKLEEDRIGNSQSYHIIVYNSGNVASPRELSVENLVYLLQQLSTLEQKPVIVTLNTRGVYVTSGLLDTLHSLDLSYRVDFNFGVETLTERGRSIYGKPQIANELAQVFGTLREYNERYNSTFGLMVNFVYLPEAYLEEGEAREGHVEKVNEEFVMEIGNFLAIHANHYIPLRINLHPFYRVATLPYDDSSLDDFMRAAICINALVDTQNTLITEQTLHVSMFVGVQDRGYETKKWVDQIKRWQHVIDAINSRQLHFDPQGGSQLLNISLVVVNV